VKSYSKKGHGVDRVPLEPKPNLVDLPVLFLEVKADGAAAKCRHLVEFASDLDPVLGTLSGGGLTAAERP